jgi:hypothetical protein
MLRSRIVTAVVVALVIALAAPAFAKGTVKMIDLRESATLAGKTLDKGVYRVEISDEGKVVFKKGKNVVAEAEGKWVDSKSAAPGDTFVIESGAIKEIRIEGQKRVFVIGG